MDFPFVFNTGNPVYGNGIISQIGQLNLLRLDAVRQFGQFHILHTDSIGCRILDSQHLAGSLIEVQHLIEYLQLGRSISTCACRLGLRLEESNLFKG